MTLTYTQFHEKCIEVEKRFNGKTLPLYPGLDYGPVKSGKLLLFGCGRQQKPDPCISETIEGSWTLDPDPEVGAQFTSPADVGDLRFDGVTAEQVFEHVPKESIEGIIGDLAGIMAPGGRILATIPNVANWWKYISDYDHRNPLTYYQLGALFEAAGIEVENVYRYTKRPEEITRASDTEKFVLYVMFKHFNMDPAAFIAVVGRKR